MPAHLKRKLIQLSLMTRPLLSVAQRRLSIHTSQFWRLRNPSPRCAHPCLYIHRRHRLCEADSPANWLRRMLCVDPLPCRRHPRHPRRHRLRHRSLMLRVPPLVTVRKALDGRRSAGGHTSRTNLTPRASVAAPRSAMIKSARSAAKTGQVCARQEVAARTSQVDVGMPRRTDEPGTGSTNATGRRPQTLDHGRLSLWPRWTAWGCTASPASRCAASRTSKTARTTDWLPWTVRLGRRPPHKLATVPLPRRRSWLRCVLTSSLWRRLWQRPDAVSGPSAAENDNHDDDNPSKQESTLKTTHTRRTVVTRIQASIAMVI